MTSAFFYQDRAGITGDFITAAHAQELLERYGGVGTLEEGFEYCTTNGEGLLLVRVHVTPVDSGQVPEDVRARLEAA